MNEANCSPRTVTTVDWEESFVSVYSKDNPTCSST